MSVSICENECAWNLLTQRSLFSPFTPVLPESPQPAACPHLSITKQVMNMELSLRPVNRGGYIRAKCIFSKHNMNAKIYIHAKTSTLKNTCKYWIKQKQIQKNKHNIMFFQKYQMRNPKIFPQNVSMNTEILYIVLMSDHLPPIVLITP